jgi:hypothetical protein
VRITRSGGLEAKESPDGSTLYFIHNGPARLGRLWRLPLPSGEESPIRELEAINLGRQWTLTKLGIYYILRTESPSICFFDFASRRSNVLFGIANKPAFGSPGPSLSPDGRSLLYSQVEREGSNVMLLENFE